MSKICNFPSSDNLAKPVAIVIFVASHGALSHSSSFSPSKLIVIKFDPSLLRETVTGLSFLLSSSFSHSFLIEIVDELVATGFGFIYSLVCVPSVFLVSLYDKVAVVFVFNL